MADELQHRVLHILNEHRDELLAHVTHTLTMQLPPIGVPANAADRDERHHTNMAHTAQRFHEIVLAGADIDWRLVEAEYTWAGHKLASMGATWAHQQVLIDAYFAEAARLQPWSDQERAALDTIAARLRSVAEIAYHQQTPPVAC